MGGAPPAPYLVTWSAPAVKGDLKSRFHPFTWQLLAARGLSGTGRQPRRVPPPVLGPPPAHVASATGPGPPTRPRPPVICPPQRAFALLMRLGNYACRT